MRSTAPDWSEALAWHLEPFRRPAREHWAAQVMLFSAEEDRGKRPPVFSYVRARKLGYRSASTIDILRYAVWDIHRYVTEAVRDFVLLHAGTVARADRALLVAGPSGVGKSTLVTGLLRSGWDYLSDELGAIDPVTGQAWPFPRRISLDPASMAFFPGVEGGLDERATIPGSPGQRFLRPEDLGSSIASASPVRWIVFPSRRREGSPRLESIPRAEAVERMAALSFNLFRYEERGLMLLSRLAREAKAFTLDGGAPNERADLLSEYHTA